MHIRTIRNIGSARKVAVIALSASLAFSLSSCASGNDAPTRMTRQVTDGVDGSITTYGNDIRVKSVLLVAQPDGSAVMTGTIVDELANDDVLLAIAAGRNNAILGSNNYPLPQNSALRFAGDTKNASAVIPDLNADPGTHVQVQLFFGFAGILSLDVLVVEKSGIYENVGN